MVTLYVLTGSIFKDNFIFHQKEYPEMKETMKVFEGYGRRYKKSDLDKITEGTLYDSWKIITTDSEKLKVYQQELVTYLKGQVESMIESLQKQEQRLRENLKTISNKEYETYIVSNDDM